MNRRTEPPLFRAIIDDDRARVKRLLVSDPKLARQVVAEKDRLEPGIAHWIYVGDTALHVATAGHRVEIVWMLLDAGADVVACGNRRRSQPLHYAADGSLQNLAWNAGQQVDTIHLLLQAGADIDAQDKNGATPLHRAVRTRCADAVKRLLAAGADFTIRNKPGSTPFHLAVQSTGRGGSGSERARMAQREIIGTFLKHGVSPGLRDARGKTVREWARSNWIREMLAGKVEKS